MRQMLVCAALLAGLLLACAPEDGPAPVAWDRTRCAQCGMLVSDPAYAAQIHTPDRQVTHYDDPGCLLIASGGGHAEPGDTFYFHHHTEDRWLRGEQTVFVETSSSPMGYRLGASDRSETPEGIPLEAARIRVTARERARSAP